MVQLPLSVVQQGLCVAEVATEWSVGDGLEGKTLRVDPPIVLVTSAQQLIVVEVDEAQDSVPQDTHQAIAPSMLGHLESELLGSGRYLSPVDLADSLESQLPGALVEEAVASHLGARASKTESQLHEVALENEYVLVGTDLTVCSGSVHLHKILRLV
jgi:hypothetical protein